ncbi:MAG: DegT/DnrJ/EryC1/StrS family aminotransferase [Spirochaetaceae bacterium]|nr:MAG: DegT/DnrJ/EryC1/StrS family aminotransferase [Spirochaetaceae bacterium]
MSEAAEIPFARPDIGNEEIEAVTRVLKSGWLTTGAEATALEAEFSAFTGSRHAIAVSSATAGLHLALEAFGIEAGDYVALSPYTFASSAEVIRYLGAHPLFVDIEPEGYNICPDALESVLTDTRKDGRRVRAIMPVHIAGHACAMGRIRDIARRFGLPVLEDAAHAIPTSDDTGARVGSQGTAVFSFYANKPVTSGEGGMVTTDDDEIARRVRLMRLHGIDRTVWDRYRRPGAGWSYDVVEAGYKYNLPDILASIGRVQLARAGETHATRARLAHRYSQHLSPVSGVTVRNNPDTDPTLLQTDAWHLYMIEVAQATRDRVIDYMAREGINCSVHYRPLHMMSYYRSRYALHDRDFPRAAARFLGTVSLPLFPGLTEEEQNRVVTTLVRALEVYSDEGEESRGTGS